MKASGLIIRKFRKADAEQVSEVIKQAFLELVPKWYSKATVEDQIQLNSPANLIEEARKNKYFTVKKDGIILGVGGYNTNKIRTFFVKPKLQGQGIGKMIMEKVLMEAKKEGFKSLKCWSTLNAVNFYSKIGFKKIKKIKLKSKNSSITFVEMRINKL